MKRGPNVVLRGGPASRADKDLYYAENQNENLKVFRGHCYDHFKRTDQTHIHNGRKLPIYTWSDCTYVAE